MPKDETLSQARIDTAAGLVPAISSDAENVYVTLSAKVLNPSLHIAVRASDKQAEEKLQRAGATTVLTPYTYIGNRVAQWLLSPHVVSFLDVALAFGRTPTWTSRSSSYPSRPAVFYRRRRWRTRSSRGAMASSQPSAAGVPENP
jgi:voltage-gated potassium channel Kch